MVRVCDYVMDFLVDKGINNIFMIAGGGSKFLNDAVGRKKELKYICHHNEQALSMAVEAHSRIKGFGVGLVTSGPGVTNAVTGVYGAWTDSTPCLFISGQVGSQYTIGNSGLRQYGVQEVDAISIVKSITKYAVMIKNPEDIKYELEKAFHLAKIGRAGPVWIDIPMDVQKAEINPEELKGFKTLEEEIVSHEEIDAKIEEIVKSIKSSKRPIIYLGQGIRLSGGIHELKKLLERIKIPVIASWNAADIIEEDNELHVGRAGMFGQRAANFAIQNCDLLLSIGSRLSISQTGYNFKAFARVAKKIIVDVDDNELKKPNVNPDVSVRCDAKIFLEKLNFRLTEELEWNSWLERCNLWKRRFLNVLPEWKAQKDFVNSYVFIDKLSDFLNEGDVITTDMGTSFTGTYQSIKLKKGQRIVTSCGAAAMGWGLASSIGACIANNRKRVICLSGEGGLQMNIQEFQTIKHNNLPVKLFVVNNQEYHTITEMQERGFDGLYVGSEKGSGVSFPDTEKIAKAYGFPFLRIENHERLEDGIKRALDSDGAFICEIMVNPKQPLEPRMTSKIGKNGKKYVPGLEDMAPFISDEEMKKNMVISLYGGEGLLRDEA
jgi:acetolactate synthase I/II/III large subunit